VISFTSRAIYRWGKRPWSILYRRLCGFQSWSRYSQEQRNLCAYRESNTDIPVIQPVACSLYSISYPGQYEHIMVCRPVAKQRPRKKIRQRPVNINRGMVFSALSAPIAAYATIDTATETVFSVRSVPRYYKQDN
jgi:hypothetical protein